MRAEGRQERRFRVRSIVYHRRWTVYFPSTYGKIFSLGGMAEWLKAPVLKTGMEQSIVGSNPSPSAFPL